MMIKVMIVDDKTENLYLLQTILETNGFKTISAKNGAEALGLLITNIPDLIITDILMPVMDGFTLCRECKKDNNLKNIPFFFYTATYTDAKDEEYALSLGADRFILKPQEPDDFIKIINDFRKDDNRKNIYLKEIKQQPETVILREYNEVLIRKIEDKMLQTDKAEKELRKYAEKLEKEIAERKKNEEFLIKSEEYNRLLFTMSPIGLALCKMDGRLVDVNPAFAKIIGRSIEETLTLSYWDITPEKYAAQEEEQMKCLIKTGYYGKYEKEYIHKDGHHVPVFLQGIILVREGEQFVWSTVEDITYRKKAESDLRESEERFRTLYNDAIVGLYRTSPQGEILLANMALVKMIGFQSFEELSARNLKEAGYGPLYKRQQFVETIEKEGEVKNMEAVWIKSDGNEIFVRESAKAIYDSEGKVLYYDGTVEDITESKRTVEDLNKMQHLFETLALVSPVGIFRTDQVGDTTYVNPKWSELSGLSSKEASGKGWLNAVHSDDREKLTESWLKNIESKNESSAEYRFLRPDGSIVWVIGKAVPELMGNEVVGYIGTITDITEHKRAEKILRESEEKYRLIFENVQDLYYETLFNGIILEVSPSIELLSKGQYRREDLIGKSIYDFYADINERSALVSQIAESGTVSDFEVTLKNKDGSYVPCSLSSKICFDAQGRPEKIIGSMHDITDRKNAIEALKLAKEKAEASDKLKTSFLNNISHEVRTPLNGILGFAEIISQTDLTEEEKSISYTMLYESTDRLLNTITNYMDISLINSGTMSLYKKDFLPESILRELYAKKVIICSARNLELYLEIPERTEKLSICSDPEMLKKILTHLLQNAIKFTEKGNIKYGYTVHKNELEFFIRDTGIGIGRESLERIFEHFVKEDRGPLKLTEGSGLGLPISKGLVELLGGKIRVESEKEKGSTFFFTLPFKRESGDITLNQDVIRQNAGERNNSILVAEDDTVNFYYLKALLQQNTTAEIIYASNGKEAVDKFKQNPDVGLILMDVKMPVMDGLEATRQIKAIKQNVPIIAITAYAMVGDEARILNAGCDEYLIKPINKKLFLDKISKHVIMR